MPGGILNKNWPAKEKKAQNQPRSKGSALYNEVLPNDDDPDRDDEAEREADHEIHHFHRGIRVHPHAVLNLWLNLV